MAATLLGTSATAITAPLAASFLGLDLGIGAAVVLVIVALLMIFGEVMIPSGGALSIGAIVVFVAAFVIGFGESMEAGLALVAATVGAVPLTLVAAFKVFPRTPIGKAVILSGDARPDGTRAVVDPHEKALLGRSGVAVTVLRPSGEAEIDGEMIDVVTGGEMVEAGAKVQVTEVQGNRIVVRPIG
jgi:membrane-bound ClpP family serine protease